MSDEVYVRARMAFVRVLEDGEIRLEGTLGPWFRTWAAAAAYTRQRFAGNHTLAGSV